ncbi:MAG: TetR/AcrR family transcriptional regulator [Chloroflexi bacterium]|nr:TetR/AcrR family transcriptional regulator [Chloroflexota bacterium]
MSRAFTKSNKEQIQHNLIQKGREYFIKYGLKKTSVDELAKAVGIAKGSFYKFFDSKEALFLTIHEESESKLRTDLMQKLEGAKEPADKLRLFLKSSLIMLEEDPLLRVVFNKGAFENLSGFMTSEQYKEHYRQAIVFMTELIKQWQEEGSIIRQLDAEVASNMVASIFYIFLQKEDAGEEMNAKVTDMLVECLVNYLSGQNK